jgi:hypothetical protein
MYGRTEFSGVTFLTFVAAQVRELQKTYAELESKGGGAQLLEDMRENIPRNCMNDVLRSLSSERLLMVRS